MSNNVIVLNNEAEWKPEYAELFRRLQIRFTTAEAKNRFLDLYKENVL